MSSVKMVSLLARLAVFTAVVLLLICPVKPKVVEDSQVSRNVTCAPSEPNKTCLTPEKPLVKRNFLSEQPVVAALAITIGIILPMAVYSYVGMVLMFIAYVECRVWIATRNAQVFSKKGPKVLNKLSDSGAVKPLPVLKSIEELATEILSSVIDVTMKDLKCEKKQPRVVKKKSASGPGKPLPIVKGIDEIAAEILSSVIDTSMKSLRSKGSFVVQKDVAKATPWTELIVGDVQPTSEQMAANVYVKEEMPAATSLGRIAARMLSSVLSIDQNGLMGYKAAVTRKTLSRGANASGQLHSATEGGHASRQVDLDPEVAGMGVFFQL